MTRMKKVLRRDITAEQANQAMTTYAIAQAQLKKLEGTIEAETSKIREKYQDKIQSNSDAAREAFEVLEAYANENQQLFADKRSVDLANGTIGFRLGTPKVECLAKKWDDALKLMDKYLPDFIRTKTEPDKEKLIAHREDPDVQKAMSLCLVTVKQNDTFFAEGKAETLQAV
jgi:phage host-nuclease inhibitor protein Gam